MDLTQLTIGERVGQGGMGAVHRAIWNSPTGGVPVAVKFIHGNASMGADLAFLREARAAARLSHPNVVTLLDAGRVTDPNGPGEIGTPYLVMEWVDGKTLRDGPPTNWAETTLLLRELLLALAHAHCWGVLHRDIKPGNVMRTPEGVVRLMDFGVGRLLDDANPEADRRSRRVTGTPRYMAPEQVLGEWRDEGPWTDMYGLGALAWALVTGQPPFVGDMQDVLISQVRERPPRLTAQFDVPHGLRNWLYTMLEKRPRDRFRSAAEARAALEQLDAGERTSRYPVVTPGHANASVATKLSVPQRHVSDDQPISTELRAAGAALFGMREPPVVGRAPEKEQMWSALRRISRLERAEAAVLMGPAGSGKTALARWLVRRTREGGHAAVLHTTHDEGVAGDVALSGTVMRWFKLDGLPAPEALERLAAGLEALGCDEPRALALDVLARRWPSSSDRRGLQDTDEWFRFLVDFAQRVGHGAPVVWLLDDIHLSAVSQAFVRFAGQCEFALLLVATTRDATGPGVRRSFDLTLGPQTNSSMRELVHSMLPLEPALTDSLVRLAEGSPLFAIQLLSDWVARDLLDPGPLGYRASTRETRVLPSDVTDLWLSRVASALEGEPPSAKEALRLLAVMGEHAPQERWRRACLVMDVPEPEQIIDILAPHGLLVVEGAEVRLAHALLRESLLSEEADLRPHHVAAANAIVVDSMSPQDSEGAARHLWAAGQQLPALDQLYTAIVRYDDAEDADAVIVLVPRLEEWAAASGEGSNVCLADALLRLHQTLRYRARTEDAAVPLAAAAEIVFADMAPRDLVTQPDGLRNTVAAGVMVGQALAARDLDPEGALTLFSQARALAVAVGNASLAIMAATLQSDVLTELGRFDQAQEVLDEALVGVRAGTVDQKTSIDANLQLAEVLALRAEYAEALAALGRAESTAKAIGRRSTVGFAISRRGDILGFAGHLEEARDAALEAAEVYAPLGTWIERVCRLNAIIFDILNGETSAHRTTAHHFVAEFEDDPLARYRGAALLAAAVCEGAVGDEARAARLLEQAIEASSVLAQREVVMLAVALAEQSSGQLRSAATSFAREHASRMPSVYLARLEAIA